MTIKDMRIMGMDRTFIPSSKGSLLKIHAFYLHQKV